MEYQQMPQQMPIGPPTPSPSPHLQLLQNGQQLLPSMVAQSQGVVPQPSHHQQQQQGLPNMPLQIGHQIGLQNPANNPANNNNNMTMPPPPTNGHHMQQHHNGHHNPHSNNNHNSQNLPPPNQILQQLHQNSGVINNGGVIGPGGILPMTGPQIGMDANNNVVGGGVGGGGGAGGGGGPDEGNRWTQFQVQQLWRHHAYLNGKDELAIDLRVSFRVGRPEKSIQ